MNTFHDPPMTAMVSALMSTRYEPGALRALAFPKLWITSTHDDLFPAALVREAAGAIGATVSVIADAGHSPYFERPDAWNDALLAFVQTVLPHAE